MVRSCWSLRCSSTKIIWRTTQAGKEFCALHTDTRSMMLRVASMESRPPETRVLARH
jgi:hypothetical protein